MRAQPYYIHAPAYRRSSAGIRVMHMLCDALNRTGGEAYVTTEVVNPQWDTPRLTDEVVARHHEEGLDPIVIYPEITNGNPLKGNTVVRYLLNQPGFIEGHGVFEDDDVLFSYTKPLLLPDMPEDRVLYLPGPDLDIFCPPSDPAKRVPGKVAYYQGRRGQAPLDRSLLPPDAIEITSRWPASWEELADLFQQCEYFYCTEASALAGEAALCGCLGVVMPNDWAPLKLEPTAYGVAWGTDPAEIERARSTIHLLRERLLKAQVDFWPALEHFVEVTQQAARERQGLQGRKHLRSWLLERVPSDTQKRLISEQLAANGEPTVGVLILDRQGDEKRLMQTIKSVGVAPNLHKAVRIMALTTGSGMASGAQAKLRFMGLDFERPQQSIDQAVRELSVDWFMVVEAGTSFTASGLQMAMLEALQVADCRALYGDEIVRDETGDMSLVLRPELNLDLLVSLPANMARHWLFNRQAWLEMGGFRAEAGEAFELDYILRLIQRAGFDGLGHVSETLLVSDARSMYDNPQERKVIERHLLERGFQHAAVNLRLPGYYDLDYGLPAGAQVSILITLKGKGLERVLRCMESILEKTSYPHFEVLLLAQDDSDPALQNWLSGMEQLGTDVIRVLRATKELSPAQVRNMAARQARGAFLLWLDEGTAVLDPDWLQQMLNHGSRPEVAAVGAKLVAADRSIRHAGFILGLNGTVGRAYVGQALESTGYLHRLWVDQNYAAVSGKCLLVRSDLFNEIGGFDETPEMQRWTDIDLCLRLHQAGYLNVWTPRAQLLITEDDEVPVSIVEQDVLYERWLPLLARDPGYHRHLSLAGNGFDLEADLNLTWRPLSWRPLPVVLVHPAHGADSGLVRMVGPFKALLEAGLLDGCVADELLVGVELQRYQPDVIVLQLPLDAGQLQALRRIRQFSRAFIVCELSDCEPLLAADEHRYGGLREVMGLVDRLVVPTAVIADAVAGLHDDIRVIETRLPAQPWRDLLGQRQRGARPRVGVRTAGDPGLAEQLITAIGRDVEWIVLGPCSPSLGPLVHEHHEHVDFTRNPKALASLDLDLALVPLEGNRHNLYLGNLDLLEFGACGVPVICSDLPPFAGNLPVTRVAGRCQDWVDSIRSHLRDLQACACRGDELRAQVQRDWILEDDALQAWRWGWMPV
jgi:glycosyltransferase involved in cell wall biosynthesis